MGRTNVIAAWILGSVSAVACSPAQEQGERGATASGSASATLGTGGLLDATTGGAAIREVGGDSSQVSGGAAGGSGASLAGSGGSEVDTGGGTTSVAGMGGTLDASNSGGYGGAGTTDPFPTAGGGSGSTEDPHPSATGGTDGNTTDPGDDDTTDPGDDDTTDPGDDDTTDPGDDDTTDPGDDDTTDPGDDDDEPDECIPTEMTDVNVIVFGDAEPSGADSEGRMVVGGNARFDGYAIASREETDCSSWGLVVGGDLTVSGGSVSSGKIAVGGTYETTGGFTAACGIWEESPVDFDALEAKMIAYSEQMMAYPVNGEATVTNGTLYLTGPSDELNVFSVTAAELENNITLDVPDGCSVIVNVSGTDVVWHDTGFMLPDGRSSCRGEQSEWCRSIMYNMYEATSIELGGIGVQGSILAPYATFTGAGGNVDGQVIVRNLYSGIEFHPYFFSGCLLLPDLEGSV